MVENSHGVVHFEVVCNQMRLETVSYRNRGHLSQRTQSLS
jgi:hypothetical protein